MKGLRIDYPYVYREDGTKFIKIPMTNKLKDEDGWDCFEVKIVHDHYRTLERNGMKNIC